MDIDYDDLLNQLSEFGQLEEITPNNSIKRRVTNTTRRETINNQRRETNNNKNTDNNTNNRNTNNSISNRNTNNMENDNGLDIDEDLANELIIKLESTSIINNDDEMYKLDEYIDTNDLKQTDNNNPFGDIPMSDAPEIDQTDELVSKKDDKKVLESPGSFKYRTNTVNETSTTLITKVIFPTHYPVKQKTVGLQKDMTIESAIVTINNILIKQNNYNTKNVGLSVQPMEHHPVEFKLLKCYPFFPESDTVLKYKEIIMNEPIYYREKIMDDNKPVGVVRLRVKFPETFPYVYKTFELQTNINVQEAIELIAKNLHFKAATVANIGLRIPKDVIKQSIKSDEVKRFQSEGIETFPFLDCQVAISKYVALIQELDYLDYTYPEDEEPEMITTQSSDLETSGEEKRNRSGTQKVQKVIEPIMWQQPDKEGFLKKQGHRVKNWKTRWFILQHDKLFYFGEKPTRKDKPLGSIFIYGAEVELEKSKEMKPFTFRVVEKLPGKEKLFYISCESKGEMYDWYSAIKKGSKSKGGPINVKHSAQFLEEQFRDLISDFDPLVVYTNYKKIGRGGFSSVWTAISTKTRKEVVIKVIKIMKLNLKYILEELLTHKTCNHPNIVSYIDAYFVPSEQQIWVSLEYMPGGNLTSKLDPDNAMQESEIAYVCKETLKALSYIHHLNRIHRDIKSDNILYGKNGEVKLADFGFCTELTSQNQRTRSIVGTPYWMAPEILERKPYGKPVDIWALGVVAIECAEGYPPFWGTDMNKIGMKISKKSPTLKSPNIWSKQFNHFISCCFKINPEERAAADDLLQHDFLMIAKKNF